MSKLSRRDALRLAGGLGIIAAPLLWTWRGHKRDDVLAVGERTNLGLEQTLLTGREIEYDGDLTPESAWPTYKIAPSTPIQPAGWQLKIGGMVERPLTLSLEDLMRMDKRTLRLEHHCVEGWSAIAEWTGVRLSDLAKRAGARSVDYVEFNSFDTPPRGRPYWSSWDYESAMHPETLIAFGFNGKPLTPKHGAPVRLYGAVKLGYKQVKHLTEINFMAKQTGGYWEDQGYEWFGGT